MAFWDKLTCVAGGNGSPEQCDKIGGNGKQKEKKQNEREKGGEHLGDGLMEEADRMVSRGGESK